ncbi:MAG: hypothetical protein ACOCY0_04600 [Roseicyclus sp.]
MTAPPDLAGILRRAGAIAIGQQAARLYHAGHTPEPHANTPEGWAKLVGWAATPEGQQLRWHFLQAFREATGERESTRALMLRLWAQADREDDT